MSRKVSECFKSLPCSYSSMPDLQAGNCRFVDEGAQQVMVFHRLVHCICQQEIANSTDCSGQKSHDKQNSCVSQAMTCVARSSQCLFTVPRSCSSHPPSSSSWQGSILCLLHLSETWFTKLGPMRMCPALFVAAENVQMKSFTPSTCQCMATSYHFSSVGMMEIFREHVRSTLCARLCGTVLPPVKVLFHSFTQHCLITALTSHWVVLVNFHSC